MWVPGRLGTHAGRGARAGSCLGAVSAKPSLAAVPRGGTQAGPCHLPITVPWVSEAARGSPCPGCFWPEPRGVGQVARAASWQRLTGRARGCGTEGSGCGELVALSLPLWLHPSFPCDFHNPARCHVSGADPGCLGGTRGCPGGGVGAALPVLQLLVGEEPLRSAKGSPSRYACRGGWRWRAELLHRAGVGEPAPQTAPLREKGWPGARRSNGRLGTVIHFGVKPGCLVLTAP